MKKVSTIIHSCVLYKALFCLLMMLSPSYNEWREYSQGSSWKIQAQYILHSTQYTDIFRKQHLVKCCNLKNNAKKKKCPAKKMSCITFKSTLCLEIVRLPKIVGALELLAPDIIIWIIAKKQFNPEILSDILMTFGITNLWASNNFPPTNWTTGV